MEKLSAGLTSLEEILRVVPMESVSYSGMSQMQTRTILPDIQVLPLLAELDAAVTVELSPALETDHQSLKRCFNHEHYKQ